MTILFAVAVLSVGWVAENTALPVRAGDPERGIPFWNEKATRFTYAPAFNFKLVEGAERYRFEVLDDLHERHDFAAARPWEPLSVVWTNLPAGFVSVKCVGVAEDGKDVGVAGERKFWKMSAFKEGAYPKRAKEYGEAAKWVYRYVLGLESTQYLLKHGKPDPKYELNSYISKMFSALIRGMLHYAKLEPSAAEEASKVARSAAEHLIAVSEPKGTPLEWFPPTYAGRGERDNGYAGEKYQGTVMLIYPAQVASAFVELYRDFGERKYLEQAERIAGTYLRLQGEDGTWYLKMKTADGSAFNKNRMIPIGSIIPMFETLFEETGKEEYRAAADRAFAYIDATRMNDWNWESQFEDVEPAEHKYQKLTKHDACATAIYLGQRFQGESARIRQMRELLRFSEDQFVCWEQPYKNGRMMSNERGNLWTKTYDTWEIPCALEQYSCYWPIDASAAKLIRTYLVLYRAEGRVEDLAKARALGDTATRMQCADGRIPTWWWPERAARPDVDWINCMMATAEALEELNAVGRSAKDDFQP